MLLNFTYVIYFTNKIYAQLEIGMPISDQTNTNMSPELKCMIA